MRYRAPLNTRAAFVLGSTHPAAPPLVPEITLLLARDVFELWEKTEQNASHAELPPPFWAFPWAGGQALARYLLDHPEYAAGRAVLDLAARAGAAAVTASETDPLALTAIELNCAANGVTLEATVGDVLDGNASGTDLVLAGDAFYERPMAERLLPYLERARASGAVVLVGDPGRAYLPRDRFEAVASYDVPVSQVMEDADVKRTTVWRLR